MPRIKVKSSLSLSDAFEAFLMSKKSEGLSNKTITTYEGHLKCISHHLNIFLPLSSYSKADFNQMIESMRNSNLSQSHNDRLSRNPKKWFLGQVPGTAPRIV